MSTIDTSSVDLSRPPTTPTEALAHLRAAEPFEAVWGLIVGRTQVLLGVLIESYHAIRKGKGKAAKLPEIVDKATHEHVVKMLTALASVSAKTYKAEKDMPANVARYLRIYADYEAHAVIIQKLIILKGQLDSINNSVTKETELSEDRSEAQRITEPDTGDDNIGAQSTSTETAVTSGEEEQCPLSETPQQQQNPDAVSSGKPASSSRRSKRLAGATAKHKK